MSGDTDRDTRDDDGVSGAGARRVLRELLRRVTGTTLGASVVVALVAALVAPVTVAALVMAGSETGAQGPVDATGPSSDGAGESVPAVLDSGPTGTAEGDGAEADASDDASNSPEADDATSDAAGPLDDGRSTVTGLTPSAGLLAQVEFPASGDPAVRLVFVGYEDVALAWASPAEALMSMTVHRYPQRILLERHGVATEVSDPVVTEAAALVRARFAPGAAGEGDLRVRETVVDGRTVRVVFELGSIDVVFLGGWEGGAFPYTSVGQAMSDLADGGYVESIITSRFGATAAEVRPALAAARALVSGEPTTAPTPTPEPDPAPPVSREVELPPSDGQLARVEVFQQGDSSVRLVFVGYEDVALAWASPAEALMSMTVHRYPQQVLLQRHGVPVSVSDPLVEGAAEQVRAFFAPEGEGSGSLRISEAVVDGRTIRVVFDRSTIDVVFLGGWESGAFSYDSTSWALGDLVDGGYIESIITSRFGATVDEVRPALAAARALVAAG